MTAKARQDIARMLEGAGYDVAVRNMAQGLPIMESTRYVASAPEVGVILPWMPCPLSPANLNVMRAVDLLHDGPWRSRAV